MRSLRRALFYWIYPPLVLVGLAAAAGAYVFMQHRLTAAYDQDLGDIARALVPYVSYRDGRVQLHFTAESDAVLRADSNDQIFYAVRDSTGRLVAGDVALPFNPPRGHDSPRFWDTTRASVEIRAAMVYAQVGPELVSIVAAETTTKRDNAARDAALSALAPALLLMMAVGAAVAFGVRRGLAPLYALGSEIHRRSHRDLSPIAEAPRAEELKPLVHSLNDMFERLSRSQEAQARFLANAAHQLRTPIAGLVTQLDLVKGFDDESTAHLEHARRAAQRLARLARQVLSLAAADPVSNPKAEREAFDLAEVMRERAVEWVRAAPSGTDLEFDLEAAEMEGSPVLLGELTANLVENATRYGGTRIRVATRTEGDRVTLEVEDNGRGIPKDAREHLFERFERGESRDNEGSGLGLAIVREIVDRHGGRIAVEDGREGGTRIVADFPRLT